MRPKNSRRETSGLSSSSNSSRSGNGVLLSLEAAHRDRAGRTTGRTQSAADADFFVLQDHRADVDVADDHGRQLARVARDRRDARRGHDLDAVLRTDVLAAAAENAFGPALGTLLEHRVCPA